MKAQNPCHVPVAATAGLLCVALWRSMRQTLNSFEHVEQAAPSHVEGSFALLPAIDQPSWSGVPDVSALMQTMPRARAGPLESSQLLNATGRAWFRHRAAANGDIVVLVINGDSGFNRVLANWLAYSRLVKSLTTPVAVVSVDQKLPPSAVAGAYFHLPFSPGNLGDFWYVRVWLLRDLTALGLNVLLTDADAIWLQDPMPSVRSAAAEADIVASRGTFPADAQKAWGATACMGFVYFRSTPGSRAILDRMLRGGRSNFDDQVRLNRALLSVGLDFPAWLQFQSSDAVDVGASSSAAVEVKLALLPHSRFPRSCPSALSAQVSVAHCLVQKGQAKGNAKMEDLKRRHLWWLDAPPIVVAPVPMASAGLAAVDARQCDSVQATHFFSKRDCSEFVSLESCHARQHNVVWLATVPGSGNTWLRYLLERSTGIYTGAIYNEGSLKRIGYLGEGARSPMRVLGVKTHGGAFGPVPDLSGAAKALVVVRHPLRAALAEASREVSGGDQSGVVSDKRMRARFEAKNYALFKQLLGQWKSHTMHFAQNCPRDRCLIVRYEDLVAHTDQMLMQHILPFLDINVSDPSIRKAVSCAVHRSTQKPSTHRVRAKPFKYTDFEVDYAAQHLHHIMRVFNYTAEVY